jgi:hypothetical protein
MPFTGDDLSWGVVKIGNYWTHGNFDNYDGRYLGNTLIITLTKMPWLLHTFYALTMAGLAVICAKLLKSIRYAVAALTLVLLLPRVVFAQTLGWNAGFINYVFSTLFMLGILALAVRELLARDDWHPPYEAGLAILLFLLAMLFSWLSEPVTLLNFISLAAFIAYGLFNHRQVRAHWWTALLGSTIGAVLMFINGGYHNTAAGTDPYRKMDLSLHALAGNARSVLSVGINSFELLFVLFAILAILLTITHWHNWTIGQRLAGMLAAADFTIFSVINLLIQHPESFSTPLKALYLLMSASVFVGLFLLIVAVSPIDLAAYYYLLAAIFLLLPYLVVTPFGPRCVFASQLLLILLLLHLTANYLELPMNMPSALVIGVIACGTLAISAPTLWSIHQGTSVRTAALTYQAQHPSAITYYPEIPHSNWWWLGNDAQNNDAKLQNFYKLPRRGGVLVPYNKWHALKTHDGKQLIQAFSKMHLQ